MPSEPNWTPVQSLLDLNVDVVALTGEPHGILSIGLLESAWAKPINRWHYGETDLLTLAVALMLGIAQNHTFQQGNKRTALAAGLMFLEGNGMCAPDLLDSTELADAFVALIEHRTDEQAFVDRLRPHVSSRG